MNADPKILKAIRALAIARETFQDAVKDKLILGNDNHIGDIGEYWVRRYFETTSQFKEYAPKKNSPYDIELSDGIRVSVKTITAWSATGYGTQIKPLCGSDWQLLAAVFLNKELFAEKIALVPLVKLLSHEPFVSNAVGRSSGATAAYPRFQWWEWLKDYNVYTHA